MMTVDQFEELLCQIRAEENLTGEGGCYTTKEADSLHAAILSAFDSAVSRAEDAELMAWGLLNRVLCPVHDMSGARHKIRLGQDCPGHKVFTGKDGLLIIDDQTRECLRGLRKDCGDSP